MVPSFAVENKLRKKKGFGAAVAPILPHVGKFFGWGVAMTSAAAVGSVTTVFVQDLINKNNLIEESKLGRIAMGCESNKAGCIDGYCWANCGPRMRSADWCFTTKEIPINLFCKVNSECSKCWPCAASCIVEGKLLP